ncbi:hypothetical protein [Sinimarinibacterium flocculans]|uniref:hypothetical protein n=1 Tax=Sinimarinibacterium flocculans TaxID=985250 RepID=UPI0011B85E46|nr:hypothetical protein [Sinimarinibacterium flocculans]
MKIRKAFTASMVGLCVCFSSLVCAAGSAGSRTAVVWEGQGLWYGTSPDLVTMGEELAAFLLQKLQAEPTLASDEAPAESVYTVLIGTSESIEKLKVSPNSIRTSDGVIPLGPQEFARFEHFINVRPIDNRLYGQADDLLADSLAYVSQAMTSAK